MIKIAHRGNILGASGLENNPDYVDRAISKNYDVEVDVWVLSSGSVWLGHDNATYKIDMKYILDRSQNLWCHAKNLSALNLMMDDNSINCFWQQDDNYAITTKGYIFTHSSITEKWLRTDKSILVSLDGSLDAFGVAGVCSDYIGKYF